MIACIGDVDSVDDSTSTCGYTEDAAPAAPCSNLTDMNVGRIGTVDAAGSVGKAEYRVAIAGRHVFTIDQANLSVRSVVEQQAAVGRVTGHYCAYLDVVHAVCFDPVVSRTGYVDVIDGDVPDLRGSIRPAVVVDANALAVG